MTRVTGVVGAVVLAVFGLACEKQGSADAKRLDELAARVDNLDARLKKIENMIAEAQGGQAAGEPDPAVVYAVPIEGDPYKGPEHAKVTIVEGYEFA